MELASSDKLAAGDIELAGLDAQGFIAGNCTAGNVPLGIAGCIDGGAVSSISIAGGPVCASDNSAGVDVYLGIFNRAFDVAVYANANGSAFPRIVLAISIINTTDNAINVYYNARASISTICDRSAEPIGANNFCIVLDGKLRVFRNCYSGVGTSLLRNDLAVFRRTTLIISKKPVTTGKSRDKATEFTTKLLLLE